MEIVDIGAGQGYLSRELAHPLQCSQANPSSVKGTEDGGRERSSISMNVLALESDQKQLDGLRKRELEELAQMPLRNKGDEDGKIAYRKMWISDTEELAGAIDDWIGESSLSELKGSEASVLLTGLHACGSLTPAALRAFCGLAPHPYPPLSGEKERRWSLKAMAFGRMLL